MRLPPALQRFDSANLRLRSISAAIMAPIALLAIWAGGLIYGAVVTGTVTLGLYEWLRLVSPTMRPQMIGFACSFLVIVLGGGIFFSPLAAALLGVIFTIALWALCAPHEGAQASWIAAGLPYMGGTGLALIALRDMPEIGAGLVLFLIMTVWGMDIGAYVAGKLIGGPKLWPAISPNKTWAGLIGGIVLALVFGFFVALALGARVPAFVLILAPLIGVVAQAGDLFESFIKRRSGVKESGDLIPGHGGVLDRIDGLAFAGMAAVVFQTLIGNSVQWW